MDIIEALETRRSVRSFTDEPIGEDVLRTLLALGTKAPSASNSQPWSFGILQGKARIRKLAEEARQVLVSGITPGSPLEKYASMLENPGYDMFHGAGTLLFVYGRKDMPWHVGDCSMCIQNIMLAAHSMGIGSCWIGFANWLCKTDAFGARMGVPADRELVGVVCMGHRKGELPPVRLRREPEILFWECTG
ncbi:MAG: nitroreductase family protein [Mailhella sp.]|nr:nitroreductase family protein [Mailhella sp.]